MNEDEWKNCSNPQAMLEFMKGKTSDRRAKLFTAAAFQLVGRLLPDKGQWQAVELLEQMADGTATPEMVRRGAAGARRAIPHDEIGAKAFVDHPHFVALMLYRSIVSSSPSRKDVLSGRSVDGAASHAALTGSGVCDEETTRAKMCCLLRDIFGNPFRPVAMEPFCLTSSVISLAKTIYDQRSFERIPQLADALTTAGCSDTGVLEHCRESGPHVRGCWVVDLVLGKEEPIDRVKEPIDRVEEARRRISPHNAACTALVETIRRDGLDCPHCGTHSKDYKLSERQDHTSAVICKACGWVIEPSSP